MVFGESMINWNPDPEIFRIGSFGLRYYALMFVIGFSSMEYVVKKIFIKYQKRPETVSILTSYIIVGTIIGARLGHCLFYDPDFYFKNPLAILKIWEGGLASHGGYAGVIIAVFIFLRKYRDLNFFWLMDVIVAPCLFVGGLIRIGNFMNSEIVGKPSDLPWAIVFQKVDNLPRHPAQLYEAIGYFGISFLLFFIFMKKNKSFKEGSNFAIAIILSFAFRFFIEFFKDEQSTLFHDSFLNMGQVLSLFCVMIGFGIYWHIYKKDKH